MAATHVYEKQRRLIIGLLVYRSGAFCASIIALYEQSRPRYSTSELTVCSICVAADATSSAYSFSRSLGKRAAGAEMPIEAITATSRLRIGAAMQQTPSVYSPWSVAKPWARIASHALASAR